MMTANWLYLLLPLVSGLAAVWLLTRPLAAESAMQALDLSGNLESLQARNARHFPQVRLALSPADEEFISRRLPPHSAARVRRERRRVLLHYTRGIAEDFAHLDRMARMIASLSPNVRRRDEWERLVLEVRFRVTYRLAVLRLTAGGQASAETLRRMTELIAGLSKVVQAGMESLESALPAEVTRGSQ